MDAVWNNLIDMELARRWYEPPDVTLLKLYNERREIARRQNVRATAWLGIAIYIGFGYVDFILVPDVATQMFLTRVGLGTIALIALESMVWVHARAVAIEVVAASTIVTFFIACLRVSFTSVSPDGLSYYLMFGMIYMLAATVFFNFRPVLSFASGLAFLVIAFSAMLLMVPTSSSFHFAFGSLYGSCFAFSILINWRMNAERYNVFLHALQAEFRQDEVLEQGKALLSLSNTDALTGLENRRSIDAKLRRLWEDWRSLDKGFAVILIDIDFFKRFNDGYGHQEGDRCLVLVANTIATAATIFDGLTGRYGGEEFIVIAAITTPEEVHFMAEHIRAAVADVGLLHEHRRDGMIAVTVSVGATVTRASGVAKLEKMVQEADRALYGAKAGGRNCARVFDPEAAPIGDDGGNIAALLKIAIAQDLVSLVYQPIRSMTSGRIDAVEALMRLRLPDGTPVAPSEFIPVAKRTGVIAELGLWAIRTVCRDLLADGRIPLASVNVSAVQLRTPGFVGAVAAILAETGIPGQRLALEITEIRDIDTQADVRLCLAELKQLGVRIWLNDFGTGFAGLSWLRLIDFDVVKIDRSFLHYCGDAEGRGMMSEIIAFIRNRGHAVLVEGIETQDQLTLMQDFRIDHAQGFHIGHPSPASGYQAAPVE